ncbi:hypothetical protein H6P81_004084 [Aristolochia fimbriata]|uniref:Cotton fiber protein n=1 Tax=Aristolochia fimbriata TaxID=158543 RepID=A0AAV7FFH0_ARIFI|nr:hypothetical protein H6P81_004084 [Aristolochia fimbriata]
MGKMRKTTLTGRAWNVIRLALFWARKGGVFKRNFMVDLIPNYVKSLRSATRDSIRYQERQFSFEETPIFHFKLHKNGGGSMRLKYLPRFPCINPPPVDFDEDDEDLYGRRSSFFRSDEEEGEGSCYDGEDIDGGEIIVNSIEDAGGDEGIDNKAEEFIAKFYEQMKLQRQVSYLQYHEMISRGAN